MNAVASPVSVSILDREYQVACPPDERPGLIAAAAYLDGKMREVRNAARSATADRIAWGRASHGAVLPSRSV